MFRLLRYVELEFGIRRRPEQQVPRAATASVWLPRREVPAPENPDVHAAQDRKIGKITDYLTHTKTQ